MRRFLTWLLIVVLPLQSAWAAVTLPCAPQAPALQVQVHEAVTLDMHGGHGVHTAHHGHEAAAAPADTGDQGASDGSQDPGNQAPRCKASAACISLHSPPLATGVRLQVPAVTSAQHLRIAEALAFSSAVLAPRHRPPIACAA